jgi:hypothetical protein
VGAGVEPHRGPTRTRSGAAPHPLAAHRRGHAEVAGQPAAARVEHPGVEAGAFHRLLVGPEAEDRVLVAVRLHDRLRSPAVHRGQLGREVGCLVAQQLGQRDGLRFEPLHVDVGTEQVGRAAQHRRAARFQAHHGQAGAQVGRDRAQAAPQHPLWRCRAARC